MYVEIHDLLSGDLRDTSKFAAIIRTHLTNYGFSVSTFARDKLFAERI
jgi:hypothetical protein